MSFAGMEMLNRGEEDGESWGNISSKDRGRDSSGSMKVGLLGGNDVGSSSSSPYSPSSERVPLRNLVDENRTHVDIDPSIICCTLFSIISATLLILLGIYGAADSESKYLILVEGGGKENGGTRGAQVGHIIGAAVKPLCPTLTASIILPLCVSPHRRPNRGSKRASMHLP